jgi:hypothetical protein
MFVEPCRKQLLANEPMGPDGLPRDLQALRLAEEIVMSQMLEFPVTDGHHRAKVDSKNRPPTKAEGMSGVFPDTSGASSDGLMGRRNASAMAAVAALCLTLVCCDDPKPREKSQSSKIADAEYLASIYTPDARERARAAAAQYLATKGATVHGMSTIEIDGSNYAVTVDLGDGAPMAQLAVRQFFAEDGSRYWKVARLDAMTARVYGLALTNSKASEQSEPEPEAPEGGRF